MVDDNVLLFFGFSMCAMFLTLLVVVVKLHLKYFSDLNMLKDFLIAEREINNEKKFGG